ncbi:hypothetical protein CFOL_v3_19383 [Cephalotus follicularis]|uniref:DUF8204 domain-containing protein n=1 Tax=Cephalotus follicularis TaxID=3775 RepID=A0A1Q3C6K2_CEPFO|nr:hypothetical protein CFOL_v3_19383 [Cephalotus follicularis]
MNTSNEIGGGEEEKTKARQTDENRKAKSCKGYLYYSSSLKSKGRNPRCIGIPRTLQQVSNYVVGQSQAEASKEGRTLLDFYYGCLGYSVALNGKDSPIDKQGEKPELPLCVGLELIVDRRVRSVDTASVPAHVHTKEDGHELPQPRTYRPTHSSGDDFMSRFTRNANVVASGVARNMRRVGNYVKESFEDILYPYRRRPK